MPGSAALNVGERNIAFVREYLRTERIALVSEDVLDIHPCKVCYFSTTGKAVVKRLAHAHSKKLLAQEKQGNAACLPACLPACLAQTNHCGSVDLF